MGQFIKQHGTDSSLTTLRKMRDKAILKRANDPATLWDRSISLLPESVRDQLVLNLASIGITKDSTGNYIKAINSDEEWAKLTNGGNKYYLIVGNDNYLLIGPKNDKPNQFIFKSNGSIPKDNEVYEDKEHDTCIMIAFTRPVKMISSKAVKA